MPKVEFLANMNISPLTVGKLRKLGWNIVRVSEIMDVKTKDIKLINYAIALLKSYPNWKKN